MRTVIRAEMANLPMQLPNKQEIQTASAPPLIRNSFPGPFYIYCMNLYPLMRMTQYLSLRDFRGKSPDAGTLSFCTSINRGGKKN